jgi:tetratricopeptide (TPR) repeat protein
MKKVNKLISLGISLVFVMQSGLYAAPAEAYRSYLIGLLASKAGDVESAIKQYQRVIKIDKNAVQAFRELAQLYLQAGQTSEAFETAEKLNSIAPGDLENQLFLGTFYLMAGYPEKARIAWEKAVQLDPMNETATVYLAAYYTDRDPGKAVEFWERFLKEKPDSGGGYYQLGIVQEKLGRMEKAKQSYEKAVEIGNGGMEAHLALAQMYEKQNDMDNAIKEYKQYIEDVPDNLTVLLYLGGLYYRIKNYDAALKIFEDSIAISPKDTNIYYWIGLIAEEKKDWGLAVKYFELLRKDEETTGVLIRLSYYYSNLKDYASARKCLERAAVIDPANPNVYFLLGLSYFDLKKYGKAEKNFKKAIELNPVFEEAYFQLGVLYDTNGKFDKAVPCFEKAISIKPEYATALNYLGYSYIDRGVNMEQGEDMIRKALRMNPDSGAYIDSLGWAYFRKGQYKEAKELLVKASLKMEDPVIFEHIGDADMKLDSKADAWDAYHKALSLDPDNKKLLNKIKDLERQVLPKTIQRKLLKRAIGNLLQIRTLKLSFTVLTKTPSVNIRNFGLFQYQGPDKWRVDIMGGFLAPKIVVIQNGNLTVRPESMQEQVDEFYMSSLSNIENYLSSRLLEGFDSEDTTVEDRGGSMKYNLGAKSLVIDKMNGAVKEYVDNGNITIKIPGQDYFEGLYIPSSILIVMPKAQSATQIKVKSLILNKDLGKNIFSME